MIHSLWNRKPKCHWRQYLKCPWNRRTWNRRRKTSRYKGRLIWRRLLCWGFRRENLQLQPALESMQRQLSVTAPLTDTEAEHRDAGSTKALDATATRARHSTRLAWGCFHVNVYVPIHESNHVQTPLCGINRLVSHSRTFPISAAIRTVANVHWLRVYNQRERSMTGVCGSPVISVCHDECRSFCQMKLRLGTLHCFIGKCPAHDTTIGLVISSSQWDSRGTVK